MKQRYDSYKPSGIDWIGDIPSHWNIVRLAHIFNAKAGGDAKPELYSDTKDAQHPFPVYTNSLSEKQVYAYTSSSTFQSGSITVTGRGEIGHAFLRDTDFDAIIRLLVLTPRIGLCCKYFTYFIDGVMEFFSDSAAVSQLSAQQINKELVILPPLSEQQAIADYLDAKCAEIDAAITKVDREIELIDELKQSEISRVVTRGLNPDTPLRPSGIDWINEIPVNWSSMKLKHTVKNIESDFMDGDWIESTDISTEGIRYLTSGNIGAGFYKEQGEGFISEDTFAELDCIEVFPGDLLISRLNEPIARTCFIPNLGYRIVTCVDNVIYRPKLGQFDKRFMMYQLNSKPFWFNASQLSSGATMQRISRSKLGSIKIIVPPLSEQQAIADYLDKKCAVIDGLKAKLIMKRETLKELRQSIISEVVTGKRKII